MYHPPKIKLTQEMIQLMTRRKRHDHQNSVTEFFVTLHLPATFLGLQVGEYV